MWSELCVQLHQLSVVRLAQLLVLLTHSVQILQRSTKVKVHDNFLYTSICLLLGNTIVLFVLLNSVHILYNCVEYLAEYTFYL